MVWKINNNCQIFIEKTDSIAGRQKEIIPHVSAYYVDKYTTISEKGVKTGSNRLCGTANQELLAGYMLYKYLGISSDEQLVRNEHGKPEIAAGYKNESAAFFNLAHSGPYVVLAISDRPVGVDIEHTKRMSYKVAKRIMRKEQLDRLDGFENESDADGSHSRNDSHHSRCACDYRKYLLLTGADHDCCKGSRYRG